MSNYIVPVLIIGVIVYAVIKKVNVYDSFTEGTKSALILVFNIFPYIAVILMCVELFKVSGLAQITVKWLEPFFTFLGMPAQLAEIVLIKPLSGNGSLALLEEVFNEYGPDSYIARCAAVIVGSSETLFYITAVYFSTVKIKKLRYAIPVALFASFAGAVIACFICRFI